MKKILIIIGLIVSTTILTTTNNVQAKELKTNINCQTNFCEGWEAGYCQGWKYVKGQDAICPIAPLCPLPRINEDNYRGGYNRGFMRGQNDAYNNPY